MTAYTIDACSEIERLSAREDIPALLANITTLKNALSDLQSDYDDLGGTLP